MNRWLIKRGENEGFTLIEVLIAIVVLSVALLALAGLQIVSIRSNSFGNHMTEAVTLAKDVMEEMKDTQWEQIQGSTDDPQGDSGIVYHRVCSVTESDEIKTVTVRVTWTWNEENHQVALVTKIANLGGNP
jgi:prepilin-type N-terminal cleavage/methylation domain-containing protein